MPITEFDRQNRVEKEQRWGDFCAGGQCMLRSFEAGGTLSKGTQAPLPIGRRED